MEWIGVDFDRTLAKYDDWIDENTLGEPIPAMIEKVKSWLADGKKVKIFTARVGINNEYSTKSKHYANKEFVENQRTIIQDWCEKHIGQRLEVTAVKDFEMTQLWDDICIQVIPNKGISIQELMESIVGTFKNDRK